MALGSGLKPPGYVKSLGRGIEIVRKIDACYGNLDQIAYELEALAAQALTGKKPVGS